MTSCKRYVSILCCFVFDLAASENVERTRFGLLGNELGSFTMRHLIILFLRETTSRAMRKDVFSGGFEEKPHLNDHGDLPDPQIHHSFQARRPSMIVALAVVEESHT
jgi:hypothetical protein